MGAVLSLQGERKVMIYSDGIEPTSAFGSKVYSSHNHQNGHTGKSFFGHSSSSSKHFKLSHALFGGGGGHNNHHNGPQHNHPLSEVAVVPNSEVQHNHGSNATYHNHHHGLKKSLGFINALHLGKHFGFGKEKKNKLKHDLTGQQSLNNTKATLKSGEDEIKDCCLTRNGIQKSLSCYNLKSGTTTTNIEIVKNINKNVGNEENNNNNGSNVGRITSHGKKDLGLDVIRQSQVCRKEPDFVFGGRKGPVILTTEQFPNFPNMKSDQNKSPNSQCSKPMIFLSKSSQVRPNVYSVLQQAYGTQIVPAHQPNTRKTSNVSLSSVGSAGTNHSHGVDTTTGQTGVHSTGQKRTVIQVS